MFVNNILNSANPIMGETKPGFTISHNAYLSAAPHPQDAHPLDLRQHDAALDTWIKQIDDAITRIDKAFSEPVDKLFANAEVEPWFAALRQPPPEGSGLQGSGLDLGLFSAGSRIDLGRVVPAPADPWAAFDRLKLRHYNNRGEPVATPVK